ncbi:MAG: right-handed parallel beta-helix repeat-containing protein [Sedimentisphaerales bacterium]|nr:right-handed parallel beta-helix repeat-containing protein [Sedimentisphaerales bacterium]
MRSGRSIPFLVVALYACGVAAGQPERIIYVDVAAVGANDGSSWPDAYVHLQDALAEAVTAAAVPLEIRVAQGVYKPDQGAGITPGDRDATFQLLNGVALKGGYAGSTSADPDARDVEGYASVLSGGYRSRQVVTGDLTDASAVIDGFTITSAYLDEMPVSGMFTGTDGLGIDSGSPVVRNCTFRNCDRALNIRTGSPSLIDCHFSENSSGAFLAWEECNSVLTRCVFDRHGIERPCFWGAVHCGEGNLKLTDCTFTENADGSIHTSGMLELVRCSFVGNSERFLGTVDCWGPLTATDCVFRDNRGEGVLVHGDAEFVGCTFVGNSGTAADVSGDTLRATRCVFSGNSHGQMRGGAAIRSFATYMELSHCVFTGNSSPSGRVGAIDSHGALSRISHCTFVGNRGEPSTMNIGAHVEMTQCIVRDGPNPFATWPSHVAPPMIVTYSNVEGGSAGEGNIDVDPCFVDPGYWDAGDTPDDLADDVWVAGDYHLKSQAGHWDAESEDWVLDDVTSPCIDAGDPNGPINAEPFPNGGYANLGAYGGTAEASRSYFGEPVCTTQIAGDINGDCRVDDFDMDLLLSHWQMEDIGRINLPPTITIVSPQDGAEFSPPEPVVFQFEASDPDGRVISLSYRLEHDHGNGVFSTGSGAADPEDGWTDELRWSHIRYDGLYVLRAKAVDDDGAVTFAPDVTITLHP